MASRDEQDEQQRKARNHPDGYVAFLNRNITPLLTRCTANCITGFSISNWLTVGFSFAPRDIAWRFPLAFQLFFTPCIYALCPFLSDSDHLFIRKGKHDEALEVLAALEGHGATPEFRTGTTQYNIIRDFLDYEHMDTYTWMQLLRGKGPSGVLRRMLLGAWM